MNVIQELQNIRSEIMLKVDTSFAELVERLENTDTIEIGQSENYETIYPITVNSALFKGKKPIAIIIGGERIDVRTWKMVVTEIMKDCNADPEKHVSLMNLRGKISGRERVLLAKENVQMRSPLEIDKNLYFETHYDTETLLRTLMTRVLDAIEYDYSNIMIATRNA